MRLRRKGFTIVEVLVVIGIIAVAFVGLMAANQFSNDSFKEIRTSQRGTQLTDEIRFALGTQDSCTRNLAGIRLPGIGEGIDVAQISYFASGQPPNRVATAGAPPEQGLGVSAMRLVPLALSVPGRYVVQFEVRLERPDTLGGENMKRSFPIDVTTNGNRIVRCTSAIDSMDFVSSVRCDILSEGMAPYDIDAETCVPRNMFEVSGNETSVSCPEGSVAPAVISAGELCWGEPPPGVSYYSLELDRTYDVDGEVVGASGGPPAVRASVNYTTSSCNCIFSVRVPSTNWTCKMACMQL